MKILSIAVLGLAFTIVGATAQSTNTNGSTSYSPTTPNFVSIPHMPTMYINGGGPGAAGAPSVKFIHDWGKYGIEAARDCNRTNASAAITILMEYQNSLGAAYDNAAAAGQDGSALLNDASVIASVVNYIRQALAACNTPQGAMLVPSPPPGEEYAAAPPRHQDDGHSSTGVSIGIGLGVGLGGGDHRHDHSDHHDNGSSNEPTTSHDSPPPPHD